MQLKEVLVLFSILILLMPAVSSVSDVHHSIDGNKVTITYEGNAPFWINIRKDENIGQDEGYVWAKTNSKTFTIDLGFAINPSKKFYYAVKDTEWSVVQSFILGDETDKCSDGILFGECSSNKPYYCDNSNIVYGGNGTLIKNCQKCGCPKGEKCQEDGSCITISGKCTELNSTFMQAYGGTCNDTKYDKKADFDNNRIINFEDLMLYGINNNNETWCLEQLEKTFDPCEAIVEKNAYISIATLKDVYEVRQKVELTDPPENENSVNPITKNIPNNVEFNSLNNQITGPFKVLNIENANLPAGRYINKETGQRLFVQDKEESQISPLIDFGSKGYIIQFKDKSILEKKNELDKKAEQNEKFINEHPIFSTITTYRFWALTPEKVPKKIKDYSGDLGRDNKKIKEKILSKVEEKRAKITGKAISNSELKIKNEFTKTFNGIVLDISEQEVAEIKKLSEIKQVYPNREVKALLMDSVPLINADDVWNLQDDSDRNITGENVTIAIIDTGIDYTHEDLGNCTKYEFLAGNCEKVIGGYDFVNDDNDPMDDNGHGTHVAGISAGNGALKGVAPDAKLYSYKVLNSWGSGYFDDIIESIERAVDPNQDGDFSDHVDIISMSLGGYGDPDDPISTAVDNAVDSGVVAVIAAGNFGPSKQTIDSPGTARKAITVGATYKKDYDGNYWQDTDPRANQITGFSSRGPIEWKNGKIIKPDIVAPGAIICSARYDNVFPEGEHEFYYPCLDEKHVQLAGTSMATPTVAGAAALLIQKNPLWSPQEIKMALRNTAVDLGYEINTQGYGLLNIEAAVNLNKPAIAEILTTGVVSGTDIDIIGTAKTDNFQSYSLFYKGEDEIEWIELCSSNEQKYREILCNFDFRTLDEKEYLFKLEVSSSSEKSLDHAYTTIENTKITSPRDLIEDKINWWDSGEIWPTWKNIIINGTSAGYDFDYYSIELCIRDTGECLKDSIILENNGGSPIMSGNLGIIDTSKVDESNFYYLVLTTHYKDGRQNIDRNLIYIETDLLPGWPRGRALEGGGGLMMSFLDQPTIADINNDGNNDIITAYGQIINVLNYDGTPLDGWPVIIDTDYNPTQKAIMQLGPAVADLDKDGYNEIIIGDNAGHIHVLNHDGTYVFEPKRIGGYLETSVIEDIDNDGNLEIIVGDWWGSLSVIGKDGNYLQGWPKYLSAPEGYSWNLGINSPVSVADFDGDGTKEIVVFSRSCNPSDGVCFPSDMVVQVWVFDHNGEILPEWPKQLNDEISGLILANIDDDSQAEIIASAYNDTIYAWNIDGSDVPNWPVKIITSEYGGNIGGPSVGDINNDNQLEILFTGTNADYMSCLYAYNVEGESLSDFPVCQEYGIIYTGFWGQAVISDIDSDEEKEIVTAVGGGWLLTSDGFLSRFYAINHDGSIVNGFPKFLDDIVFANIVPIADLDNDKDNELMIGTWSGNTFIYDLGGDSENYDWPVYHYNARHTGCYECEKEPRPQSKIVNDEDSDLTGYLTIKIQKKENENWVDHSIIINNLQKTVPAKGLLKLDAIFNPIGFTPTKQGDYRVVAEFKDKNGNIIPTIDGELKASWEFSVI